jgi:nucleoside-diphosphate-sugar epimerase
MANVLVTGASGFIGFHLVDALVARGDQVTALARTTSNVERIQPLGVKLVYGDVTDPESLPAAVAGHSIVYHLAGCLRALRVEQFYRVNEQGVRNICRACAEQPTPPALVVVSSLAAAGPSPPGRLRIERDPAAPVSDYGRSKRAGELAAEQYASRVPITVVRPPIVFGEADRDMLKIFLSVLRSRIHFVPGYAPRKFSLIHAADLADLLIRAAAQGERLAPVEQQDEANSAQGCYFAAAQEHPTYYQLGRMIGTALGLGWMMPIPLAKPVVWMVAAASHGTARARGRPAHFSIDKAREATAGAWACSAEKAVRQLGFSVTVPLADRLRQTAQWYRQEGWI